MNKVRDQVRHFFRVSLWGEDWPGASMPAVKAMRVVVLALHGLYRNRSLVRASALAYATFLALIPLLALLFAVFKGFGLQRLLEAHLMERLAPGSQEFAKQVLQYIETTKVASLGVFGVVFLLVALVVVMTNVERSFNETWRVPQTRPWLRKFSDYLSIFLIFPILLAVAISFVTGILGHPEMRRLLSQILPASFYTATTGLASMLVLWLAFTFIYLVMPNTRVRFFSALLGGIVGGSLWQVAQWIFAWFTGAATYYNAIYGALYHLLFLVIWMFWSWLIVLFGTEVAFAHQHLDHLSREWRRSPEPPLEPVDEYLALAVLLVVGTRFTQGAPPPSQEELGEMLFDGDDTAIRALEVLEDCGLIVELAPQEPGDSPRFLPRFPVDQIMVPGTLQVLRQARGSAVARLLAGEPRLAAVIRRLVEAAPAEGQDLSLQELVKMLEKESQPVSSAKP
jgi:membrane protein